jgi:CBS domain-containing protein
MPFEKRVQDVMRPLSQYPRLRSHQALEDALRIWKKALLTASPPCLVVFGADDDGNDVIKGFVTPSDMVFGIAGHFLKGAKKTGPIFWEGQLTTECEEAIKKSVKDIMTPLKGYIKDDEMIMEAIFLLNEYRVNLLPVVRQDEVTGLIHLEDILVVLSRICPK